MVTDVLVLAGIIAGFSLFILGMIIGRSIRKMKSIQDLIVKDQQRQIDELVYRVSLLHRYENFMRECEEFQERRNNSVVVTPVVEKRRSGRPKGSKNVV